jgi:hypothetical protein
MYVFSLSEAGSVFACISSQGEDKAKSNDEKKWSFLLIILLFGKTEKFANLLHA